MLWGCVWRQQVSYGSLECLTSSVRCLLFKFLPERWETAKEGYKCHERDEEHQKCDGRKSPHGFGCVGSKGVVTRTIVWV